MKSATFDLEANGLLEEATVVHCAAVKDHETGKIVTFDPSTIANLCSYLETFDCLIGHNCIYYDFPLLRKLYGWEYKGTKTDTLLISRLQRPNREYPRGFKNYSVGPHSVEAWGYRLGKYKVEHEDWSVFTPQMLERCVQDCEIQYDIHKALLKEGEGEGWEAAHKLNAKLFHYLQKQEEYGWLVDQKHIDRCLAYLDKYITRIDQRVKPLLPLITECLESKEQGEYKWLKKPFKKDGTYSQHVLNYMGDEPLPIVGPFSRVTFRPVNIDSNEEVKQFLLDSGWEPAEWNTNNEGKRTSPKLSKDDPFVGIEGSTGKLVARRIQCRHRKSQIEGWKSSIRNDGRIGAGVAGMASTGRIRHRAIVNVPSHESKAFFGKEMRQVFIARPNWVLVGTDSASNQMRQLAARLIAAFPPDGDKEFTNAVLHGDKDKGTDLHSLNQRRSGVDSRTKAKNFFYGCILFGAGDKKTAKVVGGTIEKARGLKKEFFDEMPLLRDYLEIEKEKWRRTAQKWYNSAYNRMEYKNGFITGLDGRPIAVEFEKDILVYYLQSDEAIQMAAAYVWANKQLEKRGYKWGDDYGFVIWYHDEYQVECRPEIAEEVKAICEEAIAWAGRFYGIMCPHTGEGKIGKNWFETH